MDAGTWFAFVSASIIVTLLPGPSMLLVIAHAISIGPKKSLATIMGVVLADALLLTLALIGVGEIIYSSAIAFTTLKWLGAVYLLYLGIKQWRAEPELVPDDKNQAGKTSLRAFADGFVTTMLNPKIIGFFLAFFPQFVVHRASLAGQLGVLGMTFLIIVFVIMTIYALLAGQVRVWFKREIAARRMSKASGAALIGAGLLTASLRRT